jgi:hypothetical protein
MQKVRPIKDICEFIPIKRCRQPFKREQKGDNLAKLHVVGEEETHLREEKSRLKNDNLLIKSLNPLWPLQTHKRCGKSLNCSEILTHL